MSREPIAIVGPTASGKTTLAIAVAGAAGGEIVSVDSRQIYRGMDIGTAKPSLAERRLAPHHGIDLVDPDHRFSAGQFSTFARQAIPEIQARGHLPILTGGTGFFLRALTHPIFREPDLDPQRRAALAAFLESFDDREQLRWLAALDPPSAERFQDWGGRQRVMRALEMPLLTGRTLPWWHRNAPPSEPPIRPAIFVLDLPRPLLYRRIEERVDRMLEGGLVAEVRGLREQGHDRNSPGMKTVGYAEILRALEGESSLDEAVEAIKANTRQYARRQLTWFRHRLPEGATWLDGTEPISALVRQVLDGAEIQDSRRIQ